MLIEHADEWKSLRESVASQANLLCRSNDGVMPRGLLYKVVLKKLDTLVERVVRWDEHASVEYFYWVSLVQDYIDEGSGDAFRLELRQRVLRHLHPMTSEFHGRAFPSTKTQKLFRDFFEASFGLVGIRAVGPAGGGDAS